MIVEVVEMDKAGNKIIIPETVEDSRPLIDRHAVVLKHAIEWCTAKEGDRVYICGGMRMVVAGYEGVKLVVCKEDQIAAYHDQAGYFKNRVVQDPADN